MRKNVNQVRITGRIYGFGDANGRQALEVKVTGPNSKAPGTEFIGGIMQVAVDDEGLNVIPVHFTYVTAVTSSGKTNNTFGVLKKIIEEEKTWLKVGAENATMVKIDASVGLNDFYNNDNQLVSSKLIEGSFVSTVSDLGPENERSTFKTDMIITSVARTEADPEANIDHDFVTVHGAVFNFRNALLPLDFTVRNAQGMSYFEDLNASPKDPVYTQVRGRISCMTKTTEVKEESAFGDAAVRTYTRTTRDWEITWAAPSPYEFDTEDTITADELVKALQDREVYLADVKKRAEEYKASTAKPAAAATPAAPKAATGKFNF